MVFTTVSLRGDTSAEVNQGNISPGQTAVDFDSESLDDGSNDEVDTYEDNDLLRMVSDVNILLAQYIIRSLDVEMGSGGESLPIDAELNLANALDALADIFREESIHRGAEEADRQRVAEDRRQRRM